MINPYEAARKDTAKRKALLHPDSLRCATDQDTLLDEQFARQARRAVPANVTWSLTPAPPGQPLFADKFDYPVRPTASGADLVTAKSVVDAIEEGLGR